MMLPLGRPPLHSLPQPRVMLPLGRPRLRSLCHKMLGLPLGRAPPLHFFHAAGPQLDVLLRARLRQAEALCSTLQSSSGSSHMVVAQQFPTACVPGVRSKLTACTGRIIGLLRKLVGRVASLLRTAVLHQNSVTRLLPQQIPTACVPGFLPARSAQV